MNSLTLLLVIMVTAAAIVALAWLGDRASVPGRLARMAVTGTHHGSRSTDRLPTGSPGDAGAEDQLAYSGDAGPAQPVPAGPVPPERLPSDPDAPGTGVANPTGPVAEPNEPA